MDFTILILVLPLLSFLVLGLAGTKLKPGAAGAIGTVVLGAVTVLSYLTAILYFGAGRNAEGIFPTLMPTTPFGSRSARRCISIWASCSIRSR